MAQARAADALRRHQVPPWAQSECWGRIVVRPRPPEGKASKTPDPRYLVFSCSGRGGHDCTINTISKCNLTDLCGGSRPGGAEHHGGVAAAGAASVRARLVN